MMIIKTKNLEKKYRRYKKQEGLKGSIRGLFKREYEVKCAVAGFDLEIGEGEFVGLIGPNGAGKTTLIKMLTGIIAPSAGEIDVLGYYPNDLEYGLKRQYAVVMGQKSQLFFDLTAQDTLRLYKEIYEIPDEEYERRIEYFVKLFDVKDLMDVQVRTLSLGERMKMELITALIHKPRVLFLDEPTIGLDAIAIKQIRGFLKEINQEQGITILLTSHYMEDIKTLCDRCVVVNHGRKIYDGATEQLFRQYQKNKKITMTFGERTKISIPESCLALEESEYKVVLEVPGLQTGDILQKLIAMYSPADIAIEDEDIGSVVERVYQTRGEQQ
ncbi:MAG: ABC transporter ATP-binding protein [Lachnospiraceae bacterium]